jgi:HPr kinase/phosphorylase
MSVDAPVHATALVIDETGILVRGPSGAGKTSLAMALIARARSEGRFARLVADDRVILQLRHGRIVMRAPAAISGLVEIRGAGIARISAVEGCLLRLIVDLDAGAARYPVLEPRVIMLDAVPVRRLCTQPEMGVSAVMVAVSGGFDDTAVTE